MHRPLTFAAACAAACFLVSPGAHAGVLMPPRHPLIRYTGRFDWPGVQIEARFTGTSCRLRLGGHGDALGAYVDGALACVVKLDSSKSEYTVAEGLADTEHTILIVKRFEKLGPPAEVLGIVLDSGAHLLPLPPPPPRRIEFIGGSLLTGFGVESKTLKCACCIKDSSNAYLGFGPQAARMLDARYSIVAISGKGLVREWGSPFLSGPSPFLPFFRRTLRNKPYPRWNFSSWIPDAVVISAGMNDYSTVPYPPQGLFDARYRALIQCVRHHYGALPVVCVVSPKEPLRTRVEEIVNTERIQGNSRIHFLCYGTLPLKERGCDWHPNVDGHHRIAQQLVELLGPLLKNVP